MTSVDRPLRLGLLTTLGRNIGDDFIREGLIHVVRRLAPDRALRCVAVNKHEPHTVYPRLHPIRLCYAKGFRPYRNTGPLRRQIERWLPPLGFSRFDTCDLVLQCGTPVIWEGCRDSEWARLIWRDVLARLARRGTTLLNLGGGTCYPWERRPATLLRNPDEAFVRLMLEAARVTTTRDSLTSALFATLGYKTRQICCPALLVAQAHVRPAEPTRKVLVNYMHAGGHYDWGQGIAATVWEQTIRQVLDHLLAQGWKPLLLAHDPSELALAAKLWPDVPRVCPRSAREYFEVVRDAAFGVFNRMHASVAIAGLGIPSVAAGTDTRNLMVASLGLPVFYVKEATPARMLTAINELASHRDAESRRLLTLRESTLNGYEDCLRPFIASSGLAD